MGVKHKHVSTAAWPEIKVATIEQVPAMRARYESKAFLETLLGCEGTQEDKLNYQISAVHSRQGIYIYAKQNSCHFSLDDKACIFQIHCN